MGLLPDWLNWLEHPLGSIAKFFAGGFGEALRNFWQGFIEFFFNVSIPKTKGPFVWGPPKCPDVGVCELAAIRQEVWFGGMTFFWILILYILFYAQVSSSLIGFTSHYAAKKARKKVGRGAILIIAWYPIAVGAWGFTNAVALGISPSLEDFAAAMGSVATSAAVTATISGPFGWFILGATAVGAILLKVLFELRPLMFFFYLGVGQFFLVLKYCGIPALEKIGGKFLYKFIPVLLMPLPVMGLANIYSWLFVRSDAGLAVNLVSGLLLMFFFMWASVYVTWRMFSWAAPGVASGIKKAGVVAAGVGVGAGVMASGGSSYLAAQAARGNPGRAAVMHGARNPDAARQGVERAKDAVPNNSHPFRRTENHTGGNDPLDPWGHNQD